MKFNFRKIASVLSSAVMVSSTVALAAAANFPAPFVQNGAADVAVVYGSSSAVALTDITAVADIQRALSEELAKETAVGGTTEGATASGGDYVKIETSSNKFNMNDAVTDVRTTELTNSDMPNLLKRVTYRSYDSNDYDYDQKITFYSNVNVTQFSDNDYKSRAPTIGVKVDRNAYLLNYTIAFVKGAKSDVTTAGRLEDLENTDLTVLGKSYKLLQAYNASTSTKFVLMAGAATGEVDLNEEKEVTIDGKTYTVKLTYVDASKARFSVNGETTGDILNAGVWKLADGTQIGVRSILYQSFAGGIMRVEYSLGAEKLTLENGQSLYVNDVAQDDVSVTVGRSNSGTQVQIDKIVLTWRPNDKKFVTPEQELTFPGFSSLKMTMANFTTPANEEITVDNDGNKIAEVKVPIKSGDATISLLYSNDNVNFTHIGRSTTEVLATTLSSNIVYDLDFNSDFVASWNSSNAAESYLLEATLRQSEGVNYTTIKDSVSGTEYCTDKKQGEACTIGQVVLTVTQLDYTNDIVNLTTGSGGSFNMLFSTQGMQMFLPVNDTTNQAVPGIINLTAPPTSVTGWTLVMYEEDKDSNLGRGQGLNATFGFTSNKVTVNNILPNAGAGKWSGGTTYETSSGSNTYEGYVQSALATKVDYYTGGDQDYAKVYYHGGESYANVYLSAPSVTVMSTGGTGGTVKSLGSVMYKDSESSSFANNNIIVVGGSCINTAAADLLGSATPVCGADFTALTGIDAGKALIKTYSRTGGKVATLVAGYNAADTQMAAKYLITQVVDTSVGQAYKVSSETTAEVVTTTA